MLESVRNTLTLLRNFFADRRQFPRRKARRKARLLFYVSLTEKGGSSLVPLEGHTSDISENGLALVVPSLRLGDKFLTDEECTLRIVLLDVPSGRVEIHGEPVRYQQLGGPEGGHLIGVRITRMSDSDRYRYLQYLSTLT
jgi:hypothetical protein